MDFQRFINPFYFKCSFLRMYMYLLVYICTTYMEVLEEVERVLSLLELELQAIVSHWATHRAGN